MEKWNGGSVTDSKENASKRNSITRMPQWSFMTEVAICTLEDGRRRSFMDLVYFTVKMDS
jgi:hypothetical protein